MYHGFLPEILFQRHPSRKYFNDGFDQNFWKVRRCFRPEFRNFVKVGFDQKNFYWVFSSRGIWPEKDFFGLRWILPETNKKMFSSRDLSSRKKLDVGFYQKIFFCNTLPEKKIFWLVPPELILVDNSCLFVSWFPSRNTLPETSFQKIF